MQKLLDTHCIAPAHTAAVPGLAEPLTHLMGCHACDLLMERPEPGVHAQVLCPCCGASLYRYQPQMLRRSLALVLTALLLFVPACFLPIMEVRAFGYQTLDTVWSGVVHLYAAGGALQSIAIVVFLSSMLIPLLKLLSQFLVLLSILFNCARSYALVLYRLYQHVREWGMLEVYLIGILVSLVKLLDIAEPKIGAGLICFAALLFVQVWLDATMEPQQVWCALTEDASDAGY